MRGLLRCHEINPDRKRAALDAMRRLDPTNDGPHREIHPRSTLSDLGHHDAIATTLDLLTRGTLQARHQPATEIPNHAFIALDAVWTVHYGTESLRCGPRECWVVAFYTPD
ncbi:hypothetical protein GCM10025762_42060 [Haloechinothrix salitolerans]